VNRRKQTLKRRGKPPVVGTKRLPPRPPPCLPDAGKKRRTPHMLRQVVLNRQADAQEEES
jgi:hypothetical protein